MCEEKVRVFLSQPMSGRTEAAVKETREEAIKQIDRFFLINDNDKEYEIVSTYYDQEAKDAEKFRHPKLYRLGHALMVLADCDYIFFAGDWKNKRSCVVEFLVSRMFGVMIISLDRNTDTTAKVEIIDKVTSEYEY